MQRVVDWRTGEVSTTGNVERGYPDVRDGHAVVYSRDGMRVVDVADGSTIVSGAKNESFGLSPDGRYVLGQTFDPSKQEARLVDLASGTSIPVDIGGNGLGWSPGDDVFSLTGSKLTTCPAATGECTTTTLQLAVPPGDSMATDLRLGGATYES